MSGDPLVRRTGVVSLPDQVQTAAPDDVGHQGPPRPRACHRCRLDRLPVPRPHDAVRQRRVDRCERVTEHQLGVVAHAAAATHYPREAVRRVTGDSHLGSRSCIEARHDHLHDWGVPVGDDCGQGEDRPPADLFTRRRASRHPGPGVDQCLPGVADPDRAGVAVEEGRVRYVPLRVPDLEDRVVCPEGLGGLVQHLDAGECHPCRKKDDRVDDLDAVVSQGLG